MKMRRLLIFGAVVAAVIVLSCAGCLILGAIIGSSPTYKATATARAIATTTEAARPTDASIPPPLPTETPTVTPTPTPFCTGIRFGEALVDDIDKLYNEGVEFSDVSTIEARFNCHGVSYDQIGFDWYRNGEFLCAYGNREGEPHCTLGRRSSLMDWTGQPRPFCVTLHGKGGWPERIAPGEYELIIYVDGREVTRGVITIR
jgi:hypothetical protein